MGMIKSEANEIYISFLNEDYCSNKAGINWSVENALYR